MSVAAYLDDNQLIATIQAQFETFTYRDAKPLQIGTGARYQIVYDNTRGYLLIGAPGSSTAMLYNAPAVAIPDMSGVFGWRKDFIDDYIAALWTETAVGSGTVAAESVKGGVLKLTNSAAGSDSLQTQLKVSIAQLESGKEVFFDCRIKVDHATNSTFFVGLAEQDTTVFTACDNCCGFSKADGVADVSSVTSATGTATTTDTTKDIVANTWMRLGFSWVDGIVTPYVDGVACTAHTTNLPTVVMAPVIAVGNGATASARTLRIDWMDLISVR